MTTNFETCDTLPAAAPYADPVGHTLFTPFEQSIIALAANDPPASVVPPGPARRMLHKFFGWRPEAAPLSSPRLEALRRASVLMRCARDGLPPEEEGRFLRAGFAPDHLQLLRTLAPVAPRLRRRARA